MPTLHWIGKDKVINHHMDVPFKVLEHSYGFDNGTQTDTETQSGNKIIHGDNLEALKALLPEYEGKIKCIYIDPPYNTGNEGWVYNDNVNDPKIKKWLHSVVGKEGDDLSRHDKWLCMMYPRLKLLHKLLADDGAIFISIDDIEVNHLRLILNEIFGSNSFISQLVWKSRKSEDARAKTGVSNDHEYVICYGKSNQIKFFGVDKDLTKFSNPDNDLRGPWRSADITGLATKEQRPNLHYDLLDSESGLLYPPPNKGWRFDIRTMTKKVSEGRVLFPNNPEGRPRQKMFLSEMTSKTKTLSSVITDFNTGDGTKEINALLGNGIFDFPKPSGFIGFLIEQVSSSNDIILDSFAGSGTTANAVLNLNQQDEGNRKFILIELEDYAKSITAERVKRVINGYGSAGSPTAEGTGGSFDYYELGQPLFNEDGNLNETVGVEKIRQYVWYSETKQPLSEPLILNDLIDEADLKNTSEKNQMNHNNQINPGSDSFLGKHNDTAYYFNYKKDEVTTLDHAFLSIVKTKAEQYVIYADNCLLTKAFMTRHHIIFKKIPRDITRF